MRRAFAAAALCSLLLGVGCGAAGAHKTNGWVARSLENVEAVGINDHGEIAGFRPNGNWPGGTGVAVWKNGDWLPVRLRGAANQPLPPLDNNEPFPTQPVINDRGQMIVQNKDATSGWLWQDGRQPIRLAFEPGLLDKRGDVVGQRDTGPRDDCNHDPISHAYIWRNGALRDLGVLSRFKDVRGTDVVAEAMNDRGDVAGFEYQYGCMDDHAFLWKNGTSVDLGDFGGGQSHATDVNNRGQVVGSALDSSGSWRGFLWQNGHLRDLGAWWPFAINDRGQIIGASELNPIVVHAVLWQRGTLRDLGALPGFRNSEPIGINARGQIIGISYHEDPYLDDEFGVRQLEYGTYPWVWENGHMTELPPTRKGASGGRTIAISDSGQIIGWNRDGSVLWTR